MGSHSSQLSPHDSLYKERQCECRLAKPEPSLWEIIIHSTIYKKPSSKLNLTAFPPKEELLAKQPKLKLPGMPGRDKPGSAQHNSFKKTHS
jgi:hypothetical protein